MSVLNQSGEEQVECPLCMEPLEVDDLNFYPCTCGYQICRFCWHRIRTDENGLCPACRKPYSENPADFTPLSQEQVSQLKQEKRQRDQQRKAKLTESRKHLASVRVVQRNLVFVVGLPMRLADAEVLKKHEYFGKFGKIHKVVINQSTTYAGSQGPSASAYVTYLKSDDALRAIQSVNNITLDGRPIKSSLGTTKYCSHFMKNQTCPKSDCMYLHDYGDPEASFTKEQMQAGRHQEYEKRLHDALSVKMALQAAPSGNGNGAQTIEKAGSPTGNTAKTKDTRENKETWPQLNAETNGSSTGAKGNELKETSSNSSNSNTCSKSKDTNLSGNGKSGNRSNKAKTKRNSNNHTSSSNNNNSSNSGANCLSGSSAHDKTESEVIKDSYRTLSDSESVSTSSSVADLPVAATTHSSLSGSSNGSSDSQLRAQHNHGANNSSLLDDNNSFFSSQNSYQRLDLLHNVDHHLLTQHLQDDLTTNGSISLSTPTTNTTQPPPPQHHHQTPHTPNTSLQHLNHLNLRNNHLSSLLSQQVPLTCAVTSAVIDTMEERWEAAFGASKHSNHLEELAQQRTGSVVAKPEGNGGTGFGEVRVAAAVCGGGGGGQVQYIVGGGVGDGEAFEEIGNQKLAQQMSSGSREGLMLKDYIKMFPQQNGINVPSSQQNGYNLHNGLTEKTLRYIQHQQQQQRLLEEQLLNLTLKNQQFHSRIGNIPAHNSQPTTPTSTQDPTTSHPCPPHSIYTGGPFNNPNPTPYQQHNSDPQLPPNGYNPPGPFGAGSKLLRPLADDELGFDPFQESQKGLAEFIEHEQTTVMNGSAVRGGLVGMGASLGGKMLNSNSIRANLSNGLVHGPNGLNAHHLPPPPPGFSQSTTHMNSFGSKMLPYLNMSNPQQHQPQLGNNLTGSNSWTNSFNHLHQQHKGLSNGQAHPQQQQQSSCNDWKVLDPAILSSSRHLPPLSTLRSNNLPNGTNDYLSYNRTNYGNSADNNFGGIFGNNAAALAAMGTRYQLEQPQQTFNQQQQQQQYFQQNNTHAQVSSPPPGFRPAAAAAAVGATAAAAAAAATTASAAKQQEC